MPVLTTSENSSNLVKTAVNKIIDFTNITHGNVRN